ncbi:MULTISPECIES: twin-arginine translocase TatA/TatE family subunit [Amniculibacterium]|jgi:sec-independent protein translocase protein TatB|uniref:Sec-independent protein translocase subunit TatA/TatB n=1 Tax=Amniculibacterium TaxID=2715289 RepID=UPI000F5B6222|nr:MULTISPECIES: twin-arginine translocase TatA/TatE family subunit [Amniculibacterium]
MELSIGEMLVIFLVIVIMFGPNKLPQIARDLGQGVRKMRGAMDDIKTEIMKDTDNPISEIKKEIDKVKDQVKEFDPREQLREEMDLKKYIENSNEVQSNKPNPSDSNYQGPVSR